jgi:hypothetical protein
VEWRRATAIAKSAVAASAAAATARKEQNETNTAVPQKGFRACESAVSGIVKQKQQRLVR